MEISSAHHQSMTNLPQHQHQHQQQQQQQQERKARPQQEQALNCPRCNSTNTKFCYYNNYSLSQPRYFCKGCRRYWTQGGSLRNVPVGGGCRKNKRSSSTATATNTASSKKPLDPQTIDPLLSYPISTLNHYHHHEPFLLGNHNPNPSLNLIPNMPTGAGFLDILRGGFLDSTTTTTTTSTVMNPNPNPSFMHNFFYGFDGGNAGVEEAGSVGEELMIPFEGCKVGGEGGDQNNKMMMGMQWQINGGDGSMGVDSSREYWNGSSWHGIMNNSLM